MHICSGHTRIKMLEDRERYYIYIYTYIYAHTYKSDKTCRYVCKMDWAMLHERWQRLDEQACSAPVLSKRCVFGHEFVEV